MQSSLQGDQQTGQIKNEGTLDAPQVRVDVVYLAAPGRLVGTGVVFIQNLEAGNMASFEASAPKTRSADTKTYAVPEPLSFLA